MLATLLLSFDLSVALIETISSKERSIWSDIQLHAKNEWKTSIPEMFIKLEQLSLTSWTFLLLSWRLNKNSSKIYQNRPWINWCLRRDLQRHKSNNLKNGRSPDSCIHSFKPRRRSNFPLQLWSSLLCWTLSWSSWKNSIPRRGENEKLVTWFWNNRKN